MLKRKAYIIGMSYEVSDSEKLKASRALIFFNHTLKLLHLASDHLDIMKTPFKDNPNMSPEDVMKARAALRRFRDKSIENFNLFKKSAFNCVNSMQDFSFDTQTVKIIKSFIACIDDLEYNVNKFSDLFNDLESKDFSTNVVKFIEKIQAEAEDIEEIVEERIKRHIQNNILATSWVDAVGDEIQMKIEKKTPLLLDLYNKRQDNLNDIIKERSQLGD